MHFSLLRMAFLSERGVVERVDGTRAVLQISPQEAILRREQHALAVLDDLNARVDDPFELAATPSADNCSFCPCIPFCEPFWNSARPFWGSLWFPLSRVRSCPTRAKPWSPSSFRWIEELGQGPRDLHGSSQSVAQRCSER